MHTVHVLRPGDWAPIVDGDPGRTLEIGRIVSGLPADYELVVCTGGGRGCTWFTRRPAKLGDSAQIACQHLVSVHITEAALGDYGLSEQLAADPATDWVWARVRLAGTSAPYDGAIRRAVRGPAAELPDPDLVERGRRVRDRVRQPATA